MATSTQHHEDAPRLHIPNPGVILLFLLGIVGFGLLIASLQYLVLPEQASAQAQNTDNLFHILLGFGAAIFFLVQGLLLYSAIVFRAKPNDTGDGTPIHGNATLEIIWTAIPALIVFVLAVLSFMVWNNNIEPQDDPNFVDGQSIQISAVGQRYLWSFEYSFEADVPVEPGEGGDAAAPAEVTPEAESTAEAAEGGEEQPAATDVPDATAEVDEADEANEGDADATEAPDAAATSEADSEESEDAGAEAASDESEDETAESGSLEERLAGLETERQTLSFSSSTLYTYLYQNVELTIQSPDVIHSFWIPAMRIKQDALPGYTTEVRFTPVPVDGQEYPATYPIRCAELCGGGHGAMVAEIVVFENEEQYLENFFAEERLAKIFPPDDPILQGEALLSSGTYACAGCHALEALGWTGISGPAQNGLATYADERVTGITAEEYIMQSIRQPQAFIAPPGGWGANMPAFQNDDPAGANYMSNEDLIAVVAYLCTETGSNDVGDSDCTLDFSDPAAVVAQLEELAALYD